MKKLILPLLFMLFTIQVNAQTKTEKEFQQSIEKKLSSWEAQSALDNDVQEYLAAYPNSADAYLYKGMVLKKLQKFVETINALRKSLELNPNQLDANAIMADYTLEWSIYYRDNNDKFRSLPKESIVGIISNGITAADNAVKNTTDEQTIDLYSFKSADMLTIIGYNDAAKTKLINLNSSTKSDKYKYLTYSKLAEISSEENKLSDAVDYAKKAIAIDESNPNSYRTLIPILYGQQNKLSEVFPYLKKAFSVDDNSDWIDYYYNAIAYICQEKGYSSDLLKYSLEMNQKRPDFAEAYVYAANVYYEQGQNSNFVSMMKKAAKLGNDHARNYLRQAGESW